MLPVIFALLPFALAWGQPSRGVVDFGFKTGLTVGDLLGEDNKSFFGPYSDDNFHVGLSGGPFMTINLSRTVSIQPEMSFVMRGATQDVSNTQYIYSLNYLTFPLLLRVAPFQAEAVKPLLFVGPALDLKLNADVSSETGSEDTTSPLDNARTTVFNLVIGVAAETSPGDDGIVFDLRYDLGLTRLFRSPKEGDDFVLGEDRQPDTRAGTFVISFGYVFR